MAEPKRVSIPQAANLARTGLFVTDQLIGLDEVTGAAIYAFDRTVVVRPRGPRPDGVQPYRGGGR
jgi:hypothetical protein